MNLDHHYHFYNVKYLLTKTTQLAELRLAPFHNTREICMTTPFWESFLLESGGCLLNIVNPVCPSNAEGVTALAVWLRTNKSSYFWEEVSFFVFTCLFPLGSTKYKCWFCCLPCINSGWGDLKCTILKWLLRELEVKIPSCSQKNSSVKVDELCPLLHRRDQLLFLSFVCSWWRTDCFWVKYNKDL